MKRLVFLLLCLGALGAPLCAQNIRVDGIVNNRNGAPAPGASVAVCRQPATTTTTPCTPLAALCSSLTDVVCSQPNPVTADGLGNYHFYVASANVPYTYQFYGSGLATTFLPDQGQSGATTNITPCTFSGAFHIGVGSTYTGCYGTSDLGAQANAAYAAAGNGGMIVLDGVGHLTFSTPITFTTGGKCVTLVGQGDGVTFLDYTASTGTAITEECAQQAMSYGMREIQLTCTQGSASSTTAIALGVSSSGGIYGAGGSLIENFSIHTCGTGIRYGDNTYIVALRHVVFGGNASAITYPSGLMNAGERITWDDVTFSGSGGVTTTVNINGPSEINATGVSFDQTQVILANNLGAGAFFTCNWCHFENPQAAIAYPMLWNKGYYTTVTNSTFVNDYSPAPANFIQSDGGNLIGQGNEFASLSGTVATAAQINGGTSHFTGTRTSFSANNPTTIVTKASGVNGMEWGAVEGWNIYGKAADKVTLGFNIDGQGLNYDRWEFGDNTFTGYAWSGVGSNFTPFRWVVSNAGTFCLKTGANAAIHSESYTSTPFCVSSSGITVPACTGCGAGSAPTFTTLTDGATITWAIASATVANAAVTLGGNRTLALTGLANGGTYVLKFIQDGTGSRTITLGSGCTWKVSGGGVGAVALTAAANSVDVLAFTYDGTNCLANIAKNYN